MVDGELYALSPEAMTLPPQLGNHNGIRYIFMAEDILGLLVWPKGA